MTLHEPATFATDVALAVLAAWLSWRLRARSGPGDPVSRWWGHALALTACSALIGGTYHGFAPNFPDLSKAWWLLTLVTVCLLSAALDFALLHLLSLSEQRRLRTYSWVVWTKFLAFAGAALAYPKFAVVMADYGISLLAWAAVAAMRRGRWRGWILAAFALSCVAGLVQQMRLAPSERFNHNDLYHVLQGIAVVCFYRAASRMAVPRVRAVPAV